MKNKEQSRKKIQSALIELLGERKMISVTVSDVCKKAGINRSTFYAHYQNTEGRELTREDFKRVIRHVLDHQEIFTVLLNNGRYEAYVLEKIHAQVGEENNSYYYLLNSFFFSGFQKYLLYALDHADDFSVNELADTAWQLSNSVQNILQKHQIS